MKFRNWSVGHKLMILMMVASSAALLLVCAVLLGYDVVTSKRATAEHLSTLVQIIADNSKAALSFGDQAAAGEVLATLKAEPHITASCIYDKQGKPFAIYHPKGANNSSAPPLRSPGTYYESDRLLQYLPMTLNGEEIGSVYIESDTTEVTQRYRSYAGIAAAVMIFSWLASLLVVTRMGRTITDPLNELITVARAISDSGDLEHQIDIDRKDELGDLARSFNGMIGYLTEMAAVSENIAGGDLSCDVAPRSERDTLGRAFARMTDGLGGLVRSVRQGADQVAAGSSQVASASEDSAKVSVKAASAIDEVTSTMHEMSINVQNMVKNTQMQASSVSQTSASIDEMVASIQRVADTAKVLLDISSRSRDEVQNGIGTMQKTTDGLNRINGSIGSSSTIITSLGSRVDNIGKIIEVIDDIAEQTNLLALNAAIEAARAGEHGLGFAVVADEVRKLAEKSATSTKEIGELISSIQSEARKAVDNMEKSTVIVNEGLDLGNDLSLALRKISNVVTEVFKFAQEIGAATNEQSHGSSQIAKATTQLNEITHEINSAANEQASGAGAVVNAMERMRELVQRSTSSSTELSASAEQMSKMAISLMEEMDRFKLEALPTLATEAKLPRALRAAAAHSHR
jgi:methyl-accepting chemotaxis protein